MIESMYLVFVVLFLSMHILKLERDLYSLSVTRSRESKVLIRKNIKRGFRDLMLSFVWPVLILRAAKSIFLNRQELV